MNTASSGCAKSCLDHTLERLLQSVAQGIARVQQDADRIIAFDTVLAAFAETGPKYKVSALKALTSVIGKLPAHIQSCKLDILLALALDTKAGLSYPDQVDILDSVNLLPASHRLPGLCQRSLDGLAGRDEKTGRACIERDALYAGPLRSPQPGRGAWTAAALRCGASRAGLQSARTGARSGPGSKAMADSAALKALAWSMACKRWMLSIRAASALARKGSGKVGIRARSA